jgi:multicomponent Na+:H+ antiporter subunit G
MRDVLTGGLLLTGSVLMLLAALGVARMPDLFMRMQAASKAGMAGAGLILAALSIHHGRLDVVTRALATIAFIFLTTPIGAHLLARAAYAVGVERWHRTIRDDLAGRD